MLTQQDRNALSPMMKQYFNVKDQHPNTILFFRLGDFYEMFFEDATLASKELEITLTGKDCGLEERAPMCGVPYHSCEAYIARLVEKGYKVAICEQTENPTEAKGLVSRDVVRVVTPGTIIEDSMLDGSVNNYLSAVSMVDGAAGLCFVDASTGQMHLTELSGEGVPLRVCNELGRFFPREILLDGEMGGCKPVADFIGRRLCVPSETLPDEYFSQFAAREMVERHFGHTADDLGVRGAASLSALGCALRYLYDTQRQGLETISEIEIYSESQYMRLDLAARRNLELMETLRGEKRTGTLLSVLDHTETAMGKRLLRNWMEQPLVSRTSILKRQAAVAELKSNVVLCDEMKGRLSGIHDLERLMTRIMYGTANAREIRSLGDTLKLLPTLKSAAALCKSAMLNELSGLIDPLQDVFDLLDRTLVEEPPIGVKDGGLIREGFNEEVDLLRGDMNGGTDIIAEIQQAERERTGIKGLKIGYNKVFGYYIEVTNSFKSLVPEEYIRKQTLAGCERYITEELKTLESRVLGAKERVFALEYELFDALRKGIGAELHRIQRTAMAVARLDVLRSFGEAAILGNYCQPTIAGGGVIHITGGRHPVIETLVELPFVPNDALLDEGENRCAIITGPNMAGKSTYMRQIALITLMAQIGSFVSAEKADIGITDAIFTRVGASDDIAGGQSTFMVEMSEVATILQHATRNSLIILDEIGRGTSTFDGMSIARAVLEFVSDQKRLGAKTLFATHYHELTELEGELPGVKNYNVAVKKRGDDITFLRRIVRGGADDSYGIEVAKLAGIPDEVIRRAKSVLKTLEMKTPQTGQAAAQEKAPEDQMSLVDRQGDELIDRLKRLDIDTLTPIEAMNELHRIAAAAKKI